jgi:O-antigen/teichoic acid export membrane protein
MIKDVALSLVTRVVLIGGGLFTSILTARALGVAGRGEYFYIVTLANLASQFGNLGLISSNTYSLAKDHSLLFRLAANSFWVSLVVGTLTACGILVFEAGQNKHGWIEEPVWLMIIMVPTMLYVLLASNLFIAISLIRYYNFFQLGSAMFQLLAVSIAAWMMGGVGAFLFVSALTGLIAAGVLVVMLGRLGTPTWRFDVQLFRSNLSYSGRAYVATLLGYGISRAGVLLLEFYAGKAEIGIYSVAVQFVDVLMIVPATVAMVLFPDLLKGQLKHRFARTIRIAGKLALLMAILCVLTGLVATWIVPAFFGVTFVPAIQVLWWMLPGVFFLSLANIVSQYLATKGIPLANVWAWLCGLVFLLVTSRYLIPEWGALGAAASLSMTYIFLAITLTLIAYKHYGIETKAGIIERDTIWT